MTTPLAAPARSIPPPLTSTQTFPSSHRPATTTAPTRPSSAPSTPTTPRAPLLRLVPHPRKTNTIITTRRIPPQTTLLTEHPLYTLPDTLPLASAPAHILARLAALPTRHNLWSYPPAERPHTRLEGIWETNCFASGGATVVFEALCRLQHDCAPNARLKLWEDGRGRVVRVKVVARRELREGEEVTLDLLEGSGGGVEERRRELGRRYGFWCTCLRCVGESGGLRG